MMAVRPVTLLPSSDSKDVSFNPAVPTPVGIVVLPVGSFPPVESFQTVSAPVIPSLGSFPPVDPVFPVPVAPGIVVFVFLAMMMMKNGFLRNFWFNKR
jgi:hypothetical protein